MPVKITCPHCGVKNALTEPLPLPGSQITCVDCVAKLAISYPPGVMEALKARGKSFQDHVSGNTPPRPRRRTATPSGSGWLGLSETVAPEPEPEPERLSDEELDAIDDARFMAKQQSTRAATGARRLISSLDTARRMATGLGTPEIQALIDGLLGWVDESTQASEAAAAALRRAEEAESQTEAEAAASDAKGHATKVATLERRTTDRMATLRDLVQTARADAERADADAVREAAAREVDEQRRASERLQAERREQERLEAERREQERLEQERLEAERREKERLERERLEAERREQERLERERLEAERREQERLEQERLEAERREQERLERERLEAERREQERLEQERLEAERRERERLEAERRDAALQAARADAEAATTAIDDAIATATDLDARVASAGVQSASVALAQEQAGSARQAAEAARSALQSEPADDTAAAAEAHRAHIASVLRDARTAASNATAAARTGTVAVDAAIAERDREEGERHAAIDAAGEAAEQLDATARRAQEQVHEGRELAAEHDNALIRHALAQLVRAGTRVSQSRDRAQDALQRVRSATNAAEARVAAEDVRREAYGAQTAAELVDAAALGLSEAVQTAMEAEEARVVQTQERIARIAARADLAAQAARTGVDRLQGVLDALPEDAEAQQTVRQSLDTARDAADAAHEAAAQARDADRVSDADDALARVEAQRDAVHKELAASQVAREQALERRAHREREERDQAALATAIERANEAAADAEQRLSAAHDRFDEWDDDPIGERVRVALTHMAQAVSDARSAASAAQLSTTSAEAEEHAAEAASHRSFALERLAEVTRESTLAEQERAAREAAERAAVERAAAERREEEARIAAARDAEAERIRIAGEHAERLVAELEGLAASHAPLSGTLGEAHAYAETIQHTSSSEQADSALRSLEGVLDSAREQARTLDDEAVHGEQIASAGTHASSAARALEHAESAAAAVSDDASSDVQSDALHTALERVDAALGLVREAERTAREEAAKVAQDPTDASYHLTQASLAAARADASARALQATVDAARDILRLGRQAAQERERAASATERADEEASLAAAAHEALRDARASLEGQGGESALVARLERARGRAEVVAERADAIIRHAEHAATGHPESTVRDAADTLREHAVALHEVVALAIRDVPATEASARQAEDAAASAREVLATVETAARAVHDAVREAETTSSVAAGRIEQRIERARAAAEAAQLAVSGLDHAIRADDVSAPGALDAFTAASRHAEAAQSHADDASRADATADADRAAALAVQSAEEARQAVDAAHEAIAIELGSRQHDNAALTRARARAQRAAHEARVHAQQASRIARSVDQEADDDPVEVAQGRTRVAELASAVRFAAERAEFASAEADDTTSLSMAEGAADAAETAAQEAADALLSLEDADDALASAISAGPLTPVSQRAPEAPAVRATITPTPTRAERSEAAPLAPTPLPAPSRPAPPPPAPAPVAAAAAAPVEPKAEKPAKPKRKRGRLALGGLFSVVAIAALVLLVAGAGVAFWGYNHYSAELPTLETLQAYDPPTVTTVYDHEGQLLGEIYEQRRYVRPLEEIPEHVQHAFVSAEDKAFWDHGGVNWTGLVRATLVNFTSGEKSQGASTITMQVTRNFLLTRDKTYERKIKEIILAQRIEGVYDKNHILYLYLNELYLGSGAYGVEAAARAYFGKHVDELTIAEAAMIAGLAPAPSTYSPHQNFDKAQTRQRYVLGRMLADGHITQQEHDDAVAEHITVVERSNEFLEMAPYFTEHVRRHIVAEYGHDRVYNEGLSVTTTCDLDLQKVAQDAVKKGVDEVDQRMGFRREGVEHLPQSQIADRRAAVETELIDAQLADADPAGRLDRPARSELSVDELYTGVITEVQRNYARVGIGSHEALIPLAWSEWVFDPDPTRSWRYRTQNDLTQEVTWDLPTECPDDDEDCEPDTATGPILQAGDVVSVKVAALSTQDESVSSAFRGTPGASEDLVAVRLWQDNEVEATLMSYDLDTGAVRAMVGGSDFANSEFNRATQAYRQVGSTFKPIVYAAAIESRRVTAATMVTDGPLAFSTSEDFIWKPGNYSNTYLGNMTLRKALAMSRNTCTIRVLDRIDPGMNDDIVYDFVRRLGIGGPPTHELPADWIPTPENDWTCPWVRETRDATLCADHYPPVTDDLTNTAHRAQLTDSDEHFCRACDLSMGLGSRSLTMEELMRAYSTFATGGNMVEPYYIEEVRDRNGNVLERHAAEPHVRVLDPAVASITTWLMEGVVQGGTAGRAARLGLHLAGKTGTTNDEKDMWFIGFNPEVITAVWVGYDQPRSLGVSSTGGRTALPIWMEYMEVAVPPERDRPFEMRGDIEYAQIEEDTGRRVTSGGRSYPFLRGTAPESTGVRAGQASIDDLQTEM